MNSRFTRRAALAGSLASVAALALTSIPALANDPDRRIIEAYALWRAVYDAGHDISDEEPVAWCERLLLAELAVVRQVPVTARGLAIQFVVFTNFGDFEATKSSLHDFAGTVERIAAVPAPATQIRS